MAAKIASSWERPGAGIGRRGDDGAVVGWVLVTAVPRHEGWTLDLGEELEVS